jgi:D-alanyl-lipoteichoic acid acyltransferase DltB (MBOAT superfamily)
MSESMKDLTPRQAILLGIIVLIGFLAYGIYWYLDFSRKMELMR